MKLPIIHPRFNASLNVPTALLELGMNVTDYNYSIRMFIR